MAEKSALSKHALLLRNANPEAWEWFLRSLDGYFQDLTYKVLQASTEDVLRAQGRAQAVYALLEVLKACDVEPKKPTPQ